MPSIALQSELTALLTRPQAKSEQLAARLGELSIASYIQPLFTYQSNAKKAEIADAMANADIVIFVSAPAVTFADACYPLTTALTLSPNKVQVCAVGQATTLALEALGIKDIFSPQAPLLETSEGLLQLPALQRVSNKKIIVFRGNGGREHIAQTLTERGAQLHYIESYQRVWNTLSPELLTRWQSNKINCIVATSNDILKALVQLIDQGDAAQQQFWRKHCVWLVVSQRIADNAQHLGLNQVINSQGASNQKICTALKRLQRRTS